MSNYTATQLDAFEKAATDAGKTIRPREREAGRNYLLMDEKTRSYAATAETLLKSDGTHPQEGRTGVYVRTYLEFVDKLDEAPSRGRKSGNGGGITFQSTGNIMLDSVLSQREQMLAMQDNIVTRVNDSTEAVETFDADEYKTIVADEFKAKIEELTTALEQWESDKDEVATKSAKSTIDDLTKRRDETNAASGDALANIEKQLSLSTQMLTMLIQADEDASKALKDAHADLHAELAPENAEQPA